MNDRTHHIHVQIIAWQHWTMLVLCLTVVALGYSNASAGLLEDLLEPVTEKLADQASEKGETLTTGNFYAPETPDAHAPFGMMGDHTHNKGEMMFTYRFMQMGMSGNRDGIDGVSDSEVVDGGFGFGITPTDMATQMHMFSGMYGVNNTLTLMLGAPYVIKTMDHIGGLNYLVHRPADYEFAASDRPPPP